MGHMRSEREIVVEIVNDERKLNYRLLAKYFADRYNEKHIKKS